MTIVRLDNSLAAELLLAHLRASSDVTAEHVGIGTLRVSLLGSFRADAMELELALRVRAWQAALRAKGIDVNIEILDDPAET